MARTDATLADAEAWTHTDEDAPQRLAVHPGREHVVCAFGGTLGVFRARRGASDGADEGASSSGAREARWTIESCASALGLPSRVHVTPDEREIKCAAFDAEGARLALGLESGEVKILAWPSLEVEKELGAHEKGAVTDIAWAPDGDGLLTTSAENATASNIGRGAAVWSVERGERVLTLFDESIVKKSGVRERGVSRRGVRPRHERVDERGVDWGESRRRRLGGEVGRRDVESHQQGASVQNEPISGFAVNAQGTLIAVGSSEGEVKVVDAQKFTLIKPVKKAHMIFVTTMAWNPKGNVVLSGSADASALATKIEKQSWTLRLVLWFTVFVMLIVGWITLLSTIFPDPLARALEDGDYARAAQAVADYFSESKTRRDVRNDRGRRRRRLRPRRL